MTLNDTAPVILITGASRGLGLALARHYARRGVRLILTARGASDLATATGELSLSAEVLALPGDVSDPAHAAGLVRAGLDRFGRIDVLINNASGIGPSPMPWLANHPIDDFDELFRVNVRAPLHLIQLVLPGMQRRGSGVILNVTSDAGLEAYPGWGGYGATKAALEHLSRVLSAEVAATGIRVYVVDPGDMNTAMHQAAEPGVDLSGLPNPEFVAPAILRIIDDQAVPFGRFRAQDLAAPAGAGRS